MHARLMGGLRQGCAHPPEGELTCVAIQSLWLHACPCRTLLPCCLCCWLLNHSHLADSATYGISSSQAKPCCSCGPQVEQRTRADREGRGRRGVGLQRSAESEQLVNGRAGAGLLYNGARGLLAGTNKLTASGHQQIDSQGDTIPEPAP